MLTRFYLTMTHDEWAALVRAAGQNCRDPKQEARYLLRVGLGLQRDNGQEKHNGAAATLASERGAVVSLPG